MTSPPLQPDAPFGADTDEALSALVDSELGAFASERGLTEAEARTQLEAWPDFPTRLASLQRAMESISSPPPALDDLTRRRLVRNALNAQPKSVEKPRRNRPWTAIAAVAAVGVLAIAGIGVAVSSSGDGGSDQSSSSGGATSATAPLRGDVGDLGDVTSAAALRALLDRRQAEADANQRADAPTESAGSAASDSARDVAPAPSTVAPQTGSAIAKSPEACDVAGTRPVTFTGTGTFRGAPVTVFGVTDGGRTIVFVVSDADCANVLASISR